MEQKEIRLFVQGNPDAFVIPAAAAVNLSLDQILGIMRQNDASIPQHTNAVPQNCVDEDGTEYIRYDIIPVAQTKGC